MIGDKYPEVSIKLYSGIYYLESRGYRPEEIFRIGKTLKNKAKRYYTVDNSIYENRKSAGNVIDKEAGILNRGESDAAEELPEQGSPRGETDSGIHRWIHYAGIRSDGSG